MSISVGVSENSVHWKRLPFREMDIESEEKRFGLSNTDEYPCNTDDLQIMSKNCNETLEVSSVDDEVDDHGDLVGPEKATLRSWLVVVGSFLGTTGDFGMINSLGAIQAYINIHQLGNIPTSTTAWIFSLFVGMCYICCLFSGHLFDRTGPGIPISLGALCIFGGLFATANCKEVYQFILAYGILTGFGSALCTTPILGVIPDWFPKNRRGTAISLATIGSSAGGMIFPVMLSKLYTQVGFEWAIRIYAFIISACLAVAFILCKEYPPKVRRRKEQALSFHSVPTVDDNTQNTEVLRPNIGKKLYTFLKGTFDFSSLKEPPFLFLVFASTFAEVSLFAALTYLPSYAQTQGISSSTSLAMLTVSNCTGMVGRLSQGIIADKLGPFNTTIATYIFSTIFTFVLWLAFGHTEATLFAFSAIYGFFSASVLSLTPVCISSISPASEFGKRYATGGVFGGIGMIAGMTVSGVIIDKSYSYFIVFVGVLSGLGAICLIIGRHYIVGFRINKRV